MLSVSWEDTHRQAIRICESILADASAPQLHDFAANVVAHLRAGGHLSQRQRIALGHCVRVCAWCDRPALYKAGLFGACRVHKTTLTPYIRLFWANRNARADRKEAAFDQNRRHQDTRDFAIQQLHSAKRRRK